MEKMTIKRFKENHLDFVHVVDTKGQYKDVITPLAGKFVKDCDIDIIKMLAEKNLLFDKEKYEHSYPHCWRCDTPFSIMLWKDGLLRQQRSKKK